MYFGNRKIIGVNFGINIKKSKGTKEILHGWKCNRWKL